MQCFSYPFSNEFTIQATEKNEEVKIIDLTGMEIFNASYSSVSIKLNTDLTDGIYF